MAERDIILVGGGESSKTIISSVMGILKHRVRGVLFIDHDDSTIREMYEDLSENNRTGVEIRDVRLHKRVLDKEKFENIAREMGLRDSGVTWEDPLPNHPPMVRVQVRLWEREILDALWDLLPTVGADDTHTGRLDEPRVMVVFLFGLTGMTSSTVGVQSAVVLREGLRSRLLNVRKGEDIEEINSTLDRGRMPLFVGVGCFPPDPTDGAGQYNLAHGLRMSGVIKDLLADSTSPREKDMADKPFNKFLLLDGSGAWRTQDNKADYSEWVARTLATLLTCQIVDDEEATDTFYDAIELVDSCKPFSHVGLITAGLTPNHREMLEGLRFAQENVSSVFAPDMIEPDSDLLRQMIEEMIETDAEKIIEDVRDAANQWQDAQTRLNSVNNSIRWWNFWMPGKRREKRIANQDLLNAYQQLREALSKLPSKIDDFIDETDSQWEKWSHQRIWAMPLPMKNWLEDSLEDSLPLREAHGGVGENHNIIQNRNNSRQATHDMVRMLMRHLIDPLTVNPMKVGSGTMMLVGSMNVKRDYPLPEPEDMRTSFGGKWRVLMSENDSGLEGRPMHLLLWWEPEDKKIMPLFYRADEQIANEDLPEEYDGWPSNSSQ